MKLEFYKYQGAGNDFVMIDNRASVFDTSNTKLINFLCNRRFGIGADGLICLENAEGFDFKMMYFNADGNESTMCGNGGRCIVAFAKYLNIIKDKAHFAAIDGVHKATIIKDDVSLGMQDISDILMTDTHLFLDSGSPHHVTFVSDVETVDVKKDGRKIRNGAPYFKEGSNINFVTQIDENNFKVRTYERGVEDETLSCGTGVTAVAIAVHKSGKTKRNSVILKTRGGNLEVSFNLKDGVYTDIFLKGLAVQVFKGKITT
ncbi:MAG: diaminopimelate epimerase [Flavobacteriaceae bacterium]